MSLSLAEPFINIASQCFHTLTCCWVGGVVNCGASCGVLPLFCHFEVSGPHTIPITTGSFYRLDAAMIVFSKFVDSATFVPQYSHELEMNIQYRNSILWLDSNTDLVFNQLLF